MIDPKDKDRERSGGHVVTGKDKNPVAQAIRLRHVEGISGRGP